MVLGLGGSSTASATVSRPRVGRRRTATICQELCQGSDGCPSRQRRCALPPQSSVWWRQPKFKTGSGISLNAIPGFVRHVLLVKWDFFFRHSAQKSLSSTESLQPRSYSTTMQVT